MSSPADPKDPPLAEPGKRPSGVDVGGMRATTESGVADAAQRSSERGDEPAVGRAATGDAAGGAAEPRDDLGGKAAPGSAAGTSDRRDRPASEDGATPAGQAKRGPPASSGTTRSNRANEEDEDEWRHEPIAPVDERNPLKSLGDAVADTLTGGEAETPHPAKR